MALGSLGLSRPRQARSEGVLPSCRHPTAPEPLMHLSVGDEKGKAQESKGSWAFPSFISSILSVMPDSIGHLLNPLNSSIMFHVRNVKSAYAHMRVHALACVRVCVFVHSRIHT